MFETKINKTSGKKIWLVGKDREGHSYWLEEPSFDNLNWNLGYVELHYTLIKI